jgi:hypothetical protein
VNEHEPTRKKKVVSEIVTGYEFRVFAQNFGKET